MKFQDIEHAFMFVSAAPQYANQAILSKATDEIFYISDDIDSDELPEDIEEGDQYISIPRKNELDLGKPLVMRFAREYLPNDFQYVWEIFGRRGAYANFKSFLHREQKLNDWFEYENKAETDALKQWCADNGVEITG